jgi:enterochelin esterase-like enzyme
MSAQQPELPASPPASARPRRRRRAAIAVAALVLVAVAAAGVAGTARYLSTFWAYRGFAPPSVPASIVVHSASGSRRVAVVAPIAQSFSLTSAALGGYPDQVDVVLPPGYAAHPRQHYPVLYLLHGFPGYPSAFLDIGRVVSIEAALVAAGQMKPLILVMPTGTRSYLTDQEWANSVQPGNAWETFVARDLVHAIDSRYRTIPSGGGRGIAGLSTGGYGALNIGLHHPGEFSVLESWSGYMVAEHLRAVFGQSTRLLNYNSPAVWARSVTPALRAAHLYIWFYSGATDPLTPQNRAFAAELASLGVAHHFYTVPGNHTWGLWRNQMHQALITASEHLSHG